MTRPDMAIGMLPLVETLTGSLGAFWLAVGGIAVAAHDLWRHFRS